MLNDHSQKDQKLVFKTNYRLKQVKRIEEWSIHAILSTFSKLPIVIKIFLSIYEWPFYTGFTVRRAGKPPQVLNCNILGVFRIINILGGYEDFADIFWDTTQLDYI